MKLRALDSPPPDNQTVWFYVNDGLCHINCMSYDRTGWHLGWWSGARWHSYMDKNICENDGEVVGWLPLNLPEIDSAVELEMSQGLNTFCVERIKNHSLCCSSGTESVGNVHRQEYP